MSRINQRFGKECSCHLQSGYVMCGRFRKPHIGQAVGGELDFVVLIYGAQERAAIKLATKFPPYIGPSKTPGNYIFILKMATEISAGTSANYYHYTRIKHDSRRRIRLKGCSTNLLTT
jgi:hypothetical protein